MNVIFIILFYIYPSDSQESDGGANTQDRQLQRPTLGDAEILLSACNLIDMNVIFIILFYIYPSDSQESDGGANTQDRQLQRPTLGDAEILLSA